MRSVLRITSTSRNTTGSCMAVSPNFGRQPLYYGGRYREHSVKLRASSAATRITVQAEGRPLTPTHASRSVASHVRGTDARLWVGEPLNPWRSPVFLSGGC